MWLLAALSCDVMKVIRHHDAAAHILAVEWHRFLSRPEPFSFFHFCFKVCVPATKLAIQTPKRQPGAEGKAVSERQRPHRARRRRCGAGRCGWAQGGWSDLLGWDPPSLQQLTYHAWCAGISAALSQAWPLSSAGTSGGAGTDGAPPAAACCNPTLELRH